MIEQQDSSSTFSSAIHERFHPVDITFATSGVQSVIQFGYIDGQPVIKKVSGTDLEPMDMSRLVDATSLYRATLERAGLLLPMHLTTYIDEGIINIDSVIVGKDVEMMIKEGHPHLEQVWKSMLTQLCQTVAPSGKTLAMVDAKPANFILDDETQALYYIDLFPPMLRGRDGMIVPWVQAIYKRDRRLMSFNFGDIRGQITKLMAGSQIAYPDMYPYLRAWTLQTIHGIIPFEASQYIYQQAQNNFPDMNLFYSGQNFDQKISELTLNIVSI